MNNKCSVRVWDNFYHHLCSKPATVEREGTWYCKIHDPEYIKAKAGKRQSKYESECCPKCHVHLEDRWHYCPYCGTKKGVKQ